MRPKLLFGGEEWVMQLHTYVMMGLTVLILFTQNWRWIPLAVFYGTVVLWLIREAAKRHPDLIWLTLTGLFEPLVREPHGYAWDQDEHQNLGGRFNRNHGSQG